MTDPTSPDITGALALLREAMRASPVPPAEILIFAGEACAAAGYPPTTPELDDKLRALGLLFGKAAPGSADLTHFLWHILEGNVPRALAVQALQLVQENSDFKGLSGVMTRNVLEAAREDIAAVYGGDMIKNLGLLLKSIARRAVEMTTAGMAGEVSAARSERTAAMQTIKALEADLTKIAKAYYGEEAPTGISADGIAEFIEGARSLNPGADLVTIRTAYAAAVGHDRDASAKAIAEYITALTSAHAKLSERGHALRMFGWDDELQPQTWAVIKLAELRKNVADMGSAADDLRRQRDEGHADVVRLREACQQYSDDAEKYKDKCETQKAYRARLEAGLRARGWNGEQPVESVTEGNTLNGVTKTQAPEMIRLAAVPAYAARWLKACKLLGWDTEADPAISSDGIGKMTAFMERMQALLVKPLRDELRSRQAPNLAAFGFEKATPERIVEIAAERSQADAREIGRLRAANRDLSAKIESAPGSGLRKRLKEAERIAGNPGELERRQVELEKVNSQIREATAQRNAVLAAARKDWTWGSFSSAVDLVDRHALGATQAGSLPPAGAHSLVDKAKQHRQDAHRTERERRRHDEADSNYAALALAVCPFPKEHEALLKQAMEARDRAALECAKGLPDGYRIEPVDAVAGGPRAGWRWTIGSGTWGETLDSPGVAVRQAWQRAMGYVENAHREAVRHAEKRLAELEVWDGKAWVPRSSASVRDWKVWDAFIRDIVKLTGARYHPDHVGVMLDAITRWHAVAHAK